MFAVALLDERSGRIVLARDALGIKPLVRTVGSRFAFASDAMSLVRAGLSAGNVDEQAVRKYHEVFKKDGPYIIYGDRFPLKK